MTHVQTSPARSSPPAADRPAPESWVGSPNLTHYLTAFIGRELEVTEIRRLLDDPACRLLTLLGAGGSGKTRIALQLCQQLEAEGYPVIFVDLQPVSAVDQLVTALADALNLPHGAQHPHQQLFQALSKRNLLIVLDNFEHLLSSANLIDKLLQASSGVKVLVTSRVVLHLQGEWLYPVDGLHFPAPALPLPAEPESLTTYDAVQLFLTCVRRVRPNFSLKDEATGVVRVCRLVEGSPLALELAAAWAKTMTAAAIADEIAQDLAFLASPLRNIQEKHRNMQAVFQRSWQLLNPEEQQVFQRLARFRGGFDRAAARHIADASLAVLSALVDRSLLRWRPNGRYDLHELVRQYAEEQLAQSPAELHQICNRHSAYYADFLANQHRALIGPQQRAAMAMIQTEFENVRLAWQWAVEQKRLEEIRRANLVLFSFCQRQGRYQEGLLLLEAALAMVTTCPQSPMRDQTLAEVLTGCGWLAMRLGQVVQARDAFENATTLYASGEFIPQPAMGSDPQTGLPLLAMISGDYAAALNLGQRAWQAAAARNDHPNQVVAGFGLTSAAIARGCYKEALDYARNTLALNKVVGSQWMMAYLYNQLGEITQQMGNFSAAKAYYQESYTIRQEFNDPEGMALALNHLAELAQAEADPLTAQTLYQQSLNLYKAINDRGGLVRSRYGLGLTAQQLGDEAQARQQWHAALTTAVEAQLTPLILRVITGIGAYLLERGIYERGIAALSFVQDHPASDQAVRKQAQQIVAAHDQPRPPLADHCQRPVGELQLDQLVGELLLELTLPIAPIELTPPALPPDTTPSAPPGEPLSDREVEVLRLIAAGLRNQEIAERLTVTLSTVKAHSNSIYRKLAVKSRVQAVARARALGIF